jgi:hypothetical protein
MNKWYLDEKNMAKWIMTKEYGLLVDPGENAKQYYEKTQEYTRRGIEALSKLVNDLKAQKKPILAYPAWLAGYQPHLWFENSVPSQQAIENWVKEPFTIKMLPYMEITDIISHKFNYDIVVLPHAEYKLLGIPCLVCHFKTVVMVKADLSTKDTDNMKGIGGYLYKQIVTAQNLGSFCFGPVRWNSGEGFATPVVLLHLLSKGQLEGKGIQVNERNSDSITFHVDGFDKDEVRLHDSFIRLIKDLSAKQPIVAALVAKGFIDNDTAILMEKNLDGQPSVEKKHNEELKPDPGKVVTKLTELGWTEADAQKAVSKVAFPPGASVDEILKLIL